MISLCPLCPLWLTTFMHLKTDMVDVDYGSWWSIPGAGRLNRLIRSLLIEFDLDRPLAAVADDDEFQFAQTFLIEQSIDVRSRLDRFAAHRDDAVARFQSGPLTQFPGPHFGNQKAVLGGVEEIGQLRGQRGHAHADLMAVGDDVGAGTARGLAFGDMAFAYFSFDVSATLLGQLAERLFLIE